MCELPVSSSRNERSGRSHLVLGRMPMASDSPVSATRCAVADEGVGAGGASFDGTADRAAIGDDEGGGSGVGAGGAGVAGGIGTAPIGAM
eukprot:6162364-Prymnesium_polylepis.1